VVSRWNPRFGWGSFVPLLASNMVRLAVHRSRVAVAANGLADPRVAQFEKNTRLTVDRLGPQGQAQRAVLSGRLVRRGGRRD
jgi:hypothetical protein